MLPFHHFIIHRKCLDSSVHILCFYVHQHRSLLSGSISSGSSLDQWYSPRVYGWYMVQQGAPAGEGGAPALSATRLWKQNPCKSSRLTDCLNIFPNNKERKQRDSNPITEPASKIPPTVNWGLCLNIVDFSFHSLISPGNRHSEPTMHQVLSLTFSKFIKTLYHVQLSFHSDS